MPVAKMPTPCRKHPRHPDPACRHCQETASRLRVMLADGLIRSEKHRIGAAEFVLAMAAAEYGMVLPPRLGRVRFRLLMQLRAAARAFADVSRRRA